MLNCTAAIIEQFCYQQLEYRGYYFNVLFLPFSLARLDFTQSKQEFDYENSDD